jgi:hypothetical protein
MAWYVNSELVEDSAVREEAQMMRPQYEASVTGMDPVEAEMQLREWARENVIERMLLKQAAFADPEPVPAEVIENGLASVRNDAGGQIGCGDRTTDEEIRQKIETDYRVQRLLERVQQGLKPPPEKDIAAFYKKNKDQFRTPELCWAKHVVKNVGEDGDEAAAREEIDKAHAELKEAGAVFEEVADRYSDCAGNGGDLGWFPRGEMVEEFEERVFKLPVGGMSEVFRSPFGFHVAKVFGRKPAGIRPLADVRDRIVEELMQERRHKALEDYLDALRAKADIRQSKPVAP